MAASDCCDALALRYRPSCGKGSAAASGPSLPRDQAHEINTLVERGDYWELITPTGIGPRRGGTGSRERPSYHPGHTAALRTTDERSRGTAAENMWDARGGVAPNSLVLLKTSSGKRRTQKVVRASLGTWSTAGESGGRGQERTGLKVLLNWEGGEGAGVLYLSVPGAGLGEGFFPNMAAGFASSEPNTQLPVPSVTEVS